MTSGTAEVSELRPVERFFSSVLEGSQGRELFKTIIGEWALHVSVGNDPAPFATFFLEMMRNDKDGVMRRLCTGFFTIISAREWSRMFAFLRPYLDAETIKIFEKPEAEAFYEAWRHMVYREIRSFWKQALGEESKPEAAWPSTEKVSLTASLAKPVVLKPRIQEIPKPKNAKKPHLFGFDLVGGMCRSIGCFSPGGVKHYKDGLGLAKALKCPECGSLIIRCLDCWERFAFVPYCASCTGGKGAGPAEAKAMHRPKDEDFDIDANGWYSNARRLLEDGDGAGLAGEGEAS